ncbi:hypothetical protein SpCBS45565_g00372 [Spizellomyces sp. 'palustris']|nr:hypothetical protein SpCBS45565_g00372 [Spizellomyces sp. 'palustris']
MVNFCGCFPKTGRQRRRTVPVNDPANVVLKQKVQAPLEEPQSPSISWQGENPLDIEREFPTTLDTQRWLDEFREQSNLAFLQHIEGPSSYTSEPPAAPNHALVLDHVYGYSTATQRSNYLHLYPPTTQSHPITIYPAGNTIVITQMPQPVGSPIRTVFAQHVNAITSLCVHPDGGIAASAELGPKPVITVWTLRNSVPAATASSASIPRRPKSPGSKLSLLGMQLDDDTDVVKLAVITLPSDIVHVPSLAFSKDGVYLLIAGNREDDAEVTAFDWRKADTSDLDFPAPVARAICPSRLFSIVPHPWSRRDFITTGVNHLGFWTIDVSMLSGAASLSHKEGSVNEAGLLEGSRKAVPQQCPYPTFLCATFTKHRILVTGGLNGDIVFWRMGKVDVTCRRIHKGPVLSLTALPLPLQSFLSGGGDSRIILWNDSLQPVSEISFAEHHSIRSLDGGGCGGLWLGWGAPLRRRASRALGRGSTLRPEGIPYRYGSGTVNDGMGYVTKALVGCGDGSLWEAGFRSDGSAVRTLLQESHSTANNSQLWGLATHPTDAALLLTASDDGFLRLWNVENHVLVNKRSLNTKLRSCAWAPNGSQIAVGTDDGVVHILTADIHGTTNVIRQRRDTIHDLKYSPDGNYLAVSCHEGVIDIYAVAGADMGYQRIMCCRGHSSFVTGADWSTDSARLQSNSGNSEVMFWTMTSKTPAPPLPFCDVEWATTTCPLTWGTKGVYSHGERAIQERVGTLDPIKQKVWLSRVLGSSELRNALFETSGCILGLREVICSTRGVPTDEPSAKPVLLVGTSRGDLHLLQYPAHQTGAPAYTWTSHAGPVGRVALSCDGRWAFSIGARDGCLVQYKIVSNTSITRRKISVDLWKKSVMNI